MGRLPRQGGTPLAPANDPQEHADIPIRPSDRDPSRNGRGADFVEQLASEEPSLGTRRRRLAGFFWPLAASALVLQACNAKWGADWEPLDGYQPGDIRSSIDQFSIYPDTQISLRLTYSPSSVDLRPPKYRAVAAEVYDRTRSLQEAKILQSKAAALDLPDTVKVVGEAVANDGRNLLITINYDVEGEFSDYFATVTIRQGPNFLEENFHRQAHPTNSLPATEEAMALSSIYAASSLFISESFRTMSMNEKYSSGVVRGN